MNRIKELRQSKKVTQQEVADALGITRRGFQKWENGESNIKPEKAQQLADYFGVNIGYLLGYEDSPIKELDAFIRDSNDTFFAMREYIIQTFEYIDSKEKELLYNIARVFRNQKEYYDEIENKEE